MNLTVILDTAEGSEQLAECKAALNAASTETPFELILCESSEASRGARLNQAARAAETEFILFMRSWVLADANAISTLKETLERDMSIACAAPKLQYPDGQMAPSEFILIQDECKRKPIDVLVRPSDMGRSEAWPMPPTDGVAYKADALMVRTAAFWGVGGWDETLEGDVLDLTLGLALKEQQWRCVFVKEAAMTAMRPAAESKLSAVESQNLVTRWFGRFLPHALRTSDGIMRNHPWWSLGASTVPIGMQHAPGTFDPLPTAADYQEGDIPGERCVVVVVTYNSMESIKACAASILEHLGTFDEVVFVDNGSRDETPSFLTSLAESDKRLNVILNGKNLGFSEACNIGIRASTGEYVVLLNPDTVITEGWLGRMRHYFSDNKVGAVGPISDGVCGLQRYDLHFPRKTPDSISPGEIHKLTTQVNARRGVESKLLIGFCMMLKRDVLDQIGLLDPELFLGCDDLDLSWRLRLAGFKLVIATDVFVLHRVQMSFRTETADVIRPLTQRSADALASKLIAYYGKGKVPAQADLWGIDWFESQVSVWSAVA